jgi:hypothetical protein
MTLIMQFVDGTIEVYDRAKTSWRPLKKSTVIWIDGEKEPIFKPAVFKWFLFE